jgi:Cu2+-exporting ATPase
VAEVVRDLPAAQRRAALSEVADKFGIPLDQFPALVTTLQGNAVEAPPTEAVGRAPLETPSATADGAIVEYRFRIGGMHCPSCAWLVEHALSHHQGVSEAHADFMTEIGSVRLDLRHTSREAALQALARFGYEARPLDDNSRGDSEGLVLRCATAAMAAMNTMMLAFVHYAEIIGVESDEGKTIVGALGAAMALPTVAYSGSPILRRAWNLLRLRRLAMESLLALGIVGSLAFSLLAFVLPGADFYFEIPTMIVASALGSRLLERTIRRRGAEQVAQLLRPRALWVRRHQPGVSQKLFVAIDDLTRGDTIEVGRGEEVPADVEVVGPTLSVSEALLTGEPRPVVKGRGTTVLAGSEVVEGELHGQVLRPADESAHSQIGQQVLQVLQGSSASALADRIAGHFVTATLAVAACTALLHGWVAGSSFAAPQAWLPAIAVLVVACPCAFAIAGSAASGAAVLRLLRDGVLVKRTPALERAAAADVAVFDKTGTLTSGDMQVQRLEWFRPQRPEALRTLAAVEGQSRHPMAVALRAWLAGQQVAAARDVRNVKEIPGQGVQADTDEGAFSAGAPSLFEGPADVEGDDGREPFLLFGPPSAPWGRVVFADHLRPDSAAAVDQLRQLGLEVHLLSGDAPHVVERCARQLDIAWWRGRALPEDKANHIDQLQSRGQRVLYIGDGFNDAPAMSRAAAGIALRHGVGLSLMTADLLAIKDQPTAAATTVRLARRLRRTMGQNYTWAVVYNVALVPVAALGWLHPAFAALAMFLSSVTVCANSARLLRPVGSTYSAGSFSRILKPLPQQEPMNLIRSRHAASRK